MPDVAPTHEPGKAVVGVVGIGAMGSGIAASLLRGGFDVVVCDTRPAALAPLVQAGATAADGLADVVARCDVAVIVVNDDDQVRAVVTGLLATSARLSSIIVSSTVLPGTVVRLAEEAEPHGITVLDAPVSGGAEKSARGTLTIMVGAADEPAARCAPIFHAMGTSIFHVGPVGAGSAGKLVNNLLAIGQYVVQVEAMQLADAYGITEDKAVEFITVSAGDSHGIRTWGRYDRLRTAHTLAGTPAMYEMLAKDLRYAAKAASQRDVQLPITSALGEAIGPKLIERDALIAARGGLGPERLCSVCGQELAHPFLAAGIHPLCRLHQLDNTAALPCRLPSTGSAHG